MLPYEPRFQYNPRGNSYGAGIGLVGAQRVGKTTLAAMYAKQANIPFFRTSASESLRNIGMDAKADYSFGLRLYGQMQILKDWLEQVQAVAHKPFITDRTPMDMYAYLIADVTRAGLDQQSEAILYAYRNQCFEACEQYFSHMMLVQPGIPLVETHTSAPASFCHMEHINAVMLGLFISYAPAPIMASLPRHTTDMTKRIGMLKGWLEKNPAPPLAELTFH